MSTLTDEKKKEKIDLKLPSNYKVIFHNDNETPMGLVVDILTTVFNKTENEAVDLMLQIHAQGAGIAGVYIKSIAESRKTIGNEIAKKAGFPLKITIEKE